MAAPSEAALVLRLGLGFVFLVFGAQKIWSWRGWAAVVPDELARAVEHASGLDLATLVRLLGFVETILGVHVVLGLFTRSAAAASAVLLAFIVFSMGMTGIGIRDVGLLSSSVALVLVGGGTWSLDGWISPEQRARAPRSIAT